MAWTQGCARTPTTENMKLALVPCHVQHHHKWKWQCTIADAHTHHHRFRVGTLYLPECTFRIHSIYNFFSSSSSLFHYLWTHTQRPQFMWNFILFFWHIYCVGLEAKRACTHVKQMMRKEIADGFRKVLNLVDGIFSFEVNQVCVCPFRLCTRRKIILNDEQ